MKVEAMNGFIKKAGKITKASPFGAGGVKAEAALDGGGMATFELDAADLAMLDAARPKAAKTKA